MTDDELTCPICGAAIEEVSRETAQTLGWTQDVRCANGHHGTVGWPRRTNGEGADVESVADGGDAQ